MKKTFGMILALYFLLAAGVQQGIAQPAAPLSEESDARAAVQNYLKEKSKLSGTLDLFDEDANAVRNLRTMKFYENMEAKDGGYVAKLDYRDISSGDIVHADIPVIKTDGQWMIDKVIIRSVEKADGAAGEAPKEFSDLEVQDFMKDYVSQQSKFTGSLMLYDEEHSKMRKLRLVSLDPEVRRLGIMRISGSQFEDIEDRSTLKIDITIEIKENKLTLQSLRIREIKPAS